MDRNWTWRRAIQPSGPGWGTDDETVRALQAKIGQLTMENDFLERGLDKDSRAQRQEMVERKGPLPVVRQCELLAVPRSTGGLGAEPRPDATDR